MKQALSNIKATLVRYLKPRSTVWRTTWLVMLVVVFTMVMSVVFFWRSLYMPEVRQHSHYLSSEIKLLDNVMSELWFGSDSNKQFINSHEYLDLHSVHNQDIPLISDFTQTPEYQWLAQYLSFQIIHEPEKFPNTRKKFVAEIFTNEFEKELESRLKVPVTVYFSLKPTPVLWINLANNKKFWIRQEVTPYANYSLPLIIVWLIGTPFLSLIAIVVLTRQINRPLEKLRSAANEYLENDTPGNLVTTKGPIEVRQVNKAFNQLFGALQAKDKERTVMLAGISHDLRTPLTRMRLSAEMLDDNFYKEGFIYDIEDMENILGQFIAFMRDGSDEPLKPTNMQRLIDEVLVQHPDVDIKHFVSNDLPAFMLRRISIKRMINNLVTNARKYGAQPISIIVDIEQRMIEADLTDTKSVAGYQQFLSIRVVDCGTGVNQDVIDDIKQPFVRGESARTTQGSGLGLAIVERIARLHGGSVSLHNLDACEINGNFEVRVSLPLDYIDPDL